MLLLAARPAVGQGRVRSVSGARSRGLVVQSKSQGTQNLADGMR